MTPEEIVAKFSNALDLFNPIEGHPSYVDMTRICEALSPLLLQIPYYGLNAKHNLVGIIEYATRYLARYREAFSLPTKIGVYNATIVDEAKPAVCACAKAKRRARRTDRAMYETKRREKTLFILKVVEDTWDPRTEGR